MPVVSAVAGALSVVACAESGSPVARTSLRSDPLMLSVHPNGLAMALRSDPDVQTLMGFREQFRARLMRRGVTGAEAKAMVEAGDWYYRERRLGYDPAELCARDERMGTARGAIFLKFPYIARVAAGTALADCRSAGGVIERELEL